MLRRKVVTTIAGILLGAIFSLSLVSGLALAESKIVGDETKFHPQGWSVGDEIALKKGTTVDLNEMGEVISGTLKEDEFLCPCGWKRVINDYYYVTGYLEDTPYWHRFHPAFWEGSYKMEIPGYHHLLFKSGTAITFSTKGDVLSGTLAGQAVLRLMDDQYGFITCKENTLLEFYDSGAIRSAILAEDTALRPLGWRKIVQDPAAAGFITFSANKTILFDENGYVTAATLKKPTNLLAANGKIQTFPANTAVHFTELGVATD